VMACVYMRYDKSPLDMQSGFTLRQWKGKNICIKWDRVG